MRSILKIVGLVLLGLFVVVLVAIPFTIGLRPILGPKSRPLTARRFESTPGRVERGRYLVTSVSGCVYCHGELDWHAPGFPVKAGSEGGGRSFAEEGIPFVSSPNITPDPETGAGAWTDDMFARAICEGIGHDGRTLFPLMPYTQYRYLSDEDLASIVVYLRTLPALRNTPPPTRVPFPVNRFINAVPEPVTVPVPEPNSADRVAYGYYLSRIGACRECHTPVDAQHRPIAAMEFAGGLVLEGPYGKVAARNITPDAGGIPYYDENLFIEVMRTGRVKARKLHDAMPWFFYGRMTDDDLRALFAYLQTVKPVAHTVDNELPPTHCAVCGGTHGAGEKNVAVKS